MNSICKNFSKSVFNDASRFSGTLNPKLFVGIISKQQPIKADS